MGLAAEPTEVYVGQVGGEEVGLAAELTED